MYRYARHLHVWRGNYIVAWNDCPCLFTWKLSSFIPTPKPDYVEPKSINFFYGILKGFPPDLSEKIDEYLYGGTEKVAPEEDSETYRNDMKEAGREGLLR